jgi:hypothetical protein
MSGVGIPPCCNEKSPHEIENKGDKKLPVVLQRERRAGNLLKTKGIQIAVGGATGAICLQESNWVRWVDFEGVRRTAWPIEALGKRASMAGKAGKNLA